jgi:hypothetical protein
VQRSVYLALLFTLIVCVAPKASAVFSLSDLESLFAKKRISTPEELMQHLPPEMREKYSLVYDTRNREQPATPEKPRLLLFNEDASLAVALSGMEITKHVSSAEIIAFDKKQNRFEFKSIQFLGQSTSEPLPFKIDHNPSACVGCHNERPNWDSYAVWPGFFGSTNRPNNVEKEIFTKFVGASLKTGIYQYLTGLDGRVLNNYDARTTPFLSFDDVNAEITEELNALNAVRIFDKLQNHPQFLEYRAALFAASHNSSDFLKVLPGRDDQATLSADWLSYQADAREVVEAYYRNIVLRNAQNGMTSNDLNKFSLSEDEFGPSAKLGFVAAKMKLDLARESMVFGKPTLSFTSPKYGGSMKLRILLSRLVVKDFPGLRKRLKINRALTLDDYYLVPLTDVDLVLQKIANPQFASASQCRDIFETNR